jgi:outer membrane protein
MIIRTLFLCLIFVESLRAQTSPNKVWTLQECLETGVNNNLAILKQDKSIETYSINKTQYKANKLPSINANATQNFSFGRSIDPTSNLFVLKPIYSNNFGVSGNLILFNGFQNQYNIDMASQQYMAGKWDLEKITNDLKLNIASQYLQIILNEQQKQAAKKQILTNQNLVANQSKLVNAGVQNESTFATANAELANSQYQLMLINNQLSLSKLSLSQLMQIPYDTSFNVMMIDLNKITLSQNIPDSKTLFTESSQLMPQIKSAQMNIKSSETNIKVAKGYMYPKLNLNFGVQTLFSSQNYEVTGYSVSPGTTPIGFVNNDPTQGVYSYNINPSKKQTTFTNQLKDNISQYVNLQLSIPIFTQKQIWAGIQKAKLNNSIAQINQKQTENTLRQEIETATTNASAAKEKLNMAQYNYDAKNLNYTLAKKRYDAGALNIYDYFIAQNGLIQSEFNLIQARYEYYFRVKTVEFYHGDFNFSNF